jgi:hypothetical protein
MRCFVMFLTLATAPLLVSTAQSPREANPERPTYATHAYAVTPGYLEIEQGISAFGVSSYTAGTTWNVALKVGLAPSLQAEVFGPFYARTSGGGGVGDLGLALKFRTDLSAKSAFAVIPAVTAPTGSVSKGLGAGQALGSATLVYSVDLPASFHVDLNAGPGGLGAGTPQWFFSISGSWSVGNAGLTAECFDYTPGAAAPRFAGLLGGVTFRFAPWAVLDAGGVHGTTAGSPNSLFLGLTTNLGRVF